MSTTLTQIQSEQCRRAQPLLSPGRKTLFGVVLGLLLVGAVIMRLYHLNVPFARDGYDEGVYWQSLRALLNGQSLYCSIFYSQPPAFLLSIFPGFALFGGSLWSARFSIALVSLLGFPGAYLLGKSLAGRPGALAASLLLLVNPLYLAESQTIQAEAPSVAFTLLAIGFALLWWNQPTGRRGICWAAFTGITLAVSIFCKLLCVSTIVPVALLLIVHIWRRKRSGINGRIWVPILAGVGFAFLTTLAIMLPFLGVFQDFWSDVVTFHQVAAANASITVDNYGLLSPVLFSFLGLTALYGILTALLRKNWLVLPLLAWLLVTFVLLLRWNPLFPHHLVSLIPPLISLAALSLAAPVSQKTLLSKRKQNALLSGRKRKIFVSFITGLTILLVLITLVFNVVQDVQYYLSVDATTSSLDTVQTLQIARDLHQAIYPDQWVITDDQFIAGLADRSVPPFLVDTSAVRIATNYIPLAQLERAAANPRVHAVIFTGRFYLPNVAPLHTWVARRFRLLHTYGIRQELWVR